MGKIRVKSLGIEELEKEQTQKAKKRKEAKAQRLAQGKQVKKLVKGAHGGERVVSMAPSEEELEKTLEVSRVSEVPQVPQGDETRDNRDTRKTRGTPKKPRQRSKRYRDQVIQVDKSKLYPLSGAVELLKKLGATQFDGTVELHINTVEKGVNGQVTLPHGTGKAIRVVIADPASEAVFNPLLADIEKGIIEFDILIATPAAMPHLAKVAKILGPRGLMPNPKAGTISDKPKELAKKFEGGALNFRTEAAAPIIHAVVGKVSFAEKNLEENIETFLKTVGTGKIRSVTLKSTMSPGIKIDTSTL